MVFASFKQTGTILLVISTLSLNVFGYGTYFSHVQDLKPLPHDHQTTNANFEAIMSNTRSATKDAKANAHEEFNNFDKILDQIPLKDAREMTRYKFKYGFPSNRQGQLLNEMPGRRSQLNEFHNHYTSIGNQERRKQVEAHQAIVGFIDHYSTTHPLHHVNDQTGKTDRQRLNNLDAFYHQALRDHGYGGEVEEPSTS